MKSPAFHGKYLERYFRSFMNSFTVNLLRWSSDVHYCRLLNWSKWKDGNFQSSSSFNVIIYLFNYLHFKRCLLTHLMLLSFFYTPWKQQKTFDFLMVMERDQWHEIGFVGFNYFWFFHTCGKGMSPDFLKILSELKWINELLFPLKSSENHSMLRRPSNDPIYARVHYLSISIVTLAQVSWYPGLPIEFQQCLLHNLVIYGHQSLFCFFHWNLGKKDQKTTKIQGKLGKVKCKTPVNPVAKQSWKCWVLKQHWFCGLIKAIATLFINCIGKTVLISGDCVDFSIFVTKH